MGSSNDIITGSARTVISLPIAEVFAAVTDVTRMGEWSPECVGCRWVGGAEGPAVGARFEGDNIAKAGPVTLKKWTTTSVVTDFVENETFEFVSEGYTTWRYEFEEREGKTVVTESFSFPPYTGVQGFMYGTVIQRPKTMVKGMQATLDRVKEVVEG